MSELGRYEHGEMYYFVSDFGNVNHEVDVRTERDNLRFRRGNYFPTEGTAKVAAPFMRIPFKQKGELTCTISCCT